MGHNWYQSVKRKDKMFLVGSHSFVILIRHYNERIKPWSVFKQNFTDILYMLV